MFQIDAFSLMHPLLLSVSLFRYYNDLFWNINSISPFYTYSLPCTFSKLFFLLFFTPECPEWRLFTGLMAFFLNTYRLSLFKDELLRHKYISKLWPSISVSLFSSLYHQVSWGTQVQSHLCHFPAPFSSKIHLVKRWKRRLWNTCTDHILYNCWTTIGQGEESKHANPNHAALKNLIIKSWNG